MSINSVFLVGRLGAAPELKTTTSGKAVCNFSVATNGWRSDAEEPPAEWHRIVVWERQGENCYKYLNRGSHVAIQGRIRTHKWERNGEPRYSTEVVARHVTFLGGKRTDEAPAAAEAAPAPAAETPRPAAEAPRPGAGARGRRRRGEPDLHDDIPF